MCFRVTGLHTRLHTLQGYIRDEMFAHHKGAPGGGSSNLSVWLYTSERADANSILRDICCLKYRRKSIYCKSQLKY